MAWSPGLGMTLCLMALSMYRTEGRVSPLPYLPEELQYHFDVYKTMTTLEHQPGSNIFWSSLQQYMSEFVEHQPSMTPAQARFFRESIEQFMKPVYAMHNNNQNRGKRQAAQPPRVRREIRAMTLQQRRDYFRAVNRMKRDTRVTPNLYDVLMDFHSGINIRRAHFGPAFPAWHRLYLWIYESFLRQYIPSVTVPYWASVLDNEMRDPTESVLWSGGFFGNGFGEINTGPFRDWRSINPNTVFRRNIGGGPLYTHNDIAAILSKRFNRQILVPTADADSNFELMHGGPHTFVGGSMNLLNEAVRDPIFYSHHAFVDYIWEQFRLQQRDNGINPQDDYPFNATDPRFGQLDMHHPDAMMGFFPNNEFNIDYRNRVGYWNVFFTLVTYEPIPTCERTGQRCTGNSPYLRCNRNLPIPRCVSRTRQSMQGQAYINDIFADGNSTTNITNTTTNTNSTTLPEDTCPRRPFMKEIDSFRVPSGNNSLTWAYIPVKIITKRPPNYPEFSEYSLYSYPGSRTSLPNTKREFLQPGNQKGYEKCDKHEDSVGKIKIVTYGINYYGMTEEYAVIDNRLGVSQSTGFAIVKMPQAGTPSDAMVSASDSCGRTCKPYCMKGTRNSATSGGIRVTSDVPMHYWKSYADAMLETWDMPLGMENPIIESGAIPITFYCDYTSDWIWDGPGSGIQTDMYPIPTIPPPVITNNNTLIPNGNTAIDFAPPVPSSNRTAGNNKVPVKPLHQATFSESMDYLRNSQGNDRMSLPPTTIRRGKRPNRGGRPHSGRPLPRGPPTFTQWIQGTNRAPVESYVGRPRSQQSGCRLSTECMIGVPCSPCINYETRRCAGSMEEAICVNNQFMLYNTYLQGF